MGEKTTISVLEGNNFVVSDFAETSTPRQLRR